MTSTRSTAAFALISVLLAVVFSCSDAADSSDANCSTTCIAEQCHTIGIRYGKYCGVGYWGCPGEKPCDDVDACCMAHDDCVDRFGMIHTKCHIKLKNCLTRVQDSGKVGFSDVCPVSIAAPTMIKAMDVAAVLTQLGDTVEDSLSLINKFCI